MGIEKRKALLKYCNPRNRYISLFAPKLYIGLSIIGGIFVGLGFIPNAWGCWVFGAGICALAQIVLIVWVASVLSSIESSTRATNELLYLFYSGELEQAQREPDEVSSK